MLPQVAIQLERKKKHETHHFLDPQQPKSAWEYYLDMTRIEDTEREREVTEQVDTQLVFVRDPRNIEIRCSY